MRLILKEGLLVILPETEPEQLEFSAWQLAAQGHVFAFASSSGQAGLLHDLGTREDACREPINVTSMAEPRWQPIGNFALTPFFLDGRHYSSVEGFWQGLKFDSEGDRRRIGALHGPEAKKAGELAEARSSISYQDREISVGTWDHWALMRQACEAKFDQNAEARDALLATANRPLTHRLRRDSRTIPGVVMADIWMRVRARLQGEDDGE